ncbi:MAG TPA: DUF4199 family protein [Flavitalea sp.]|nr:DUF4199 family protein [Flavitalea sp.]
MRNATIQGLISGIILSILLIIGFYLMIQLPKDTSVNSYTNQVLYSGIVAVTTWISLKQLVKRIPLGMNRMLWFLLVAIVITAAFFSFATYAYARFIDPNHLATLLENSKQNWAEQNYSLQSIAGQGEWTWYSSPFNYAQMELRVMLFSLFIIMLPVATVFYIRYKNKLSPEPNSNPELIY